MIVSTDAIVLHLSKHKDNTWILHTYTKENGRVNMMVYGVGSKKGKMPTSLFLPLQQIHLIYNVSNDKPPIVKEVTTINSTKCSQNQNIINSTIQLFISEILFNTLTQPLNDENLFNYLVQIANNSHQDNIDSNFHILFILHFLEYLGISIDFDIDTQYFDLIQAEGINSLNGQELYFTKDEISLLNDIYYSSNVKLNRKTRQTLLRKLCRYIEYQIEGFSTPKSLDILEVYFDEL